MVDMLKEYEKYKAKLKGGYIEKSVYSGVKEIDDEKNRKAMEERLKALDRLIDAENAQLHGMKDTQK